jgi:ABC-type transport system involved in multi-copper enzyme maturation permease subunit
VLNIIKADLYRIFRGKTIYITLVILLALLVLQVLYGADGLIFGVMVYTEDASIIDADGALNEIISSNNQIMTGNHVPFSFAAVTDNLIYFMLPFIAIIAAADFSNGAVKNLISSGISRNKYFFAKFILLALFCVILMVIYVILPIILGTVINGFDGEFNIEFIKDVAKIYLPQFFLVFAFVCIGLFISFTFKSVAALNTIYIMFSLLPTIVLAILVEFNDKFFELMNYIPVFAIKSFAIPGSIATSDFVKMMITGCVYIVVCTVGGILLFRKAEIK